MKSVSGLAIRMADSRCRTKHWVSRAIGPVFLAVAAAAPGQDRFPEFSWERVPLYMHIRKDTSFTPDEIRYLAGFPLIAFEKTTGGKEFGSTEAGTLAAARAVKAINPAAKILYYRNLIVHYDGYAANGALAEIRDPFLTAGDGNERLVRGRLRAYDLSNRQVRAWWIASAAQVCADPAIDGLFVDGAVKALEPAYLRAEIGEEKKAALVEGYGALAQELRRGLPPEKLLLANLLRARFADSGLSRLAAFDGTYIEGFDMATGGMAARDYVAKGIAAFQQAARQGYIVAFTGGLGAEEAEDANNPQWTDEMRAPRDTESASRRFSFLLAVFLVCAEKHSYFHAHDGYDAGTSQVWMTRPPEYDCPLGAPKGPAVQSGYAYSREFEHASVRLDVERKIGQIDWKAPR